MANTTDLQQLKITEVQQVESVTDNLNLVAEEGGQWRRVNAKGHLATLDNTGKVPQEQLPEIKSYSGEGENSFVANNSAVASGSHSAALGQASQATSQGSYAEGTNTLAGSKGFTVTEVYVADYDNGELENAYKLDSVEGLEVGDIYSVHLYYGAIVENYDPSATAGENQDVSSDNYGSITKIDTDNCIVYVDNLFYGNKVEDPAPTVQYMPYVTEEDGSKRYWNVNEWGYATDHNVFRIISKPHIGTRNLGYGAHAEGHATQALTKGSHAEGYGAVAYGNMSHAEGRYTQAGYVAHAEGNYTIASGSRSHAEGSITIASGNNAHAEGYNTVASGVNSHAEGSNTRASAHSSHAGGTDTVASGERSFATGNSSQATANNAFAMNSRTQASGIDSFASNADTHAYGKRSHAEGYMTTAYGESSHAEGVSGEQADVDDIKTLLDEYVDYQFAISTTGSKPQTIAYGVGSHAEGYGGKSLGDYSHAEGYITTASNNGAHTEGCLTTAYGVGSHAEGGSSKTAPLTEDGFVITQRNTIERLWGETKFLAAFGNYSHAEGQDTLASGLQSHAEGWKTIASGERSHAEGNSCQATANNCHAEGSSTLASYVDSHAEGNHTVAKGQRSHAEGYYTIAASIHQHVQGKFNVEDANVTYAHIVGNGTSDTARSNAHTLDWSGNAWFAGSVTSNGADYAEYFEWQDGNPNNEDRIGLLVTLDGENIKLANAGDEILGIISGTVAVLGDNYECEWNGKYLTDDFGRIQYEDVEEFEEVIKEVENKETGEMEEVIEQVSLGFFKHPILNPDYDFTQIYVNRQNRPEWATVGMLGKLFVRDDGTSQVNGYVTVGENGVATASSEKTNMRVLSRVNENVIRVLLK